jgi:hypothetical protein
MTKQNPACTFIEELISNFKPEYALLLSTASPSLLSIPEEFCSRVMGLSNFQNCDQSELPDFIIGDFPLSMTVEQDTVLGQQIKIRKNWLMIAKALEQLKAGGQGLFLVEEGIVNTEASEKFLKLLTDNGWYVQALFRCGKDAIKGVSIRPLMILVGPAEVSAWFVADIESHQQARQLVDSYAAGNQGKTLTSGIIVNSLEFNGFARLQAKLKIAELKTQYKEYTQHNLLDLTRSINSVNKDEIFEDLNNCVYLSKFGAKDRYRATKSLSEIEGKHHLWFQLELSELIVGGYLVGYLRSSLGGLSLESISKGSITSNLSKSELESLQISLPTKEEQYLIADTHNKLKELRIVLNDMDTNLAINPQMTHELLPQLNNMLDVTGALSEAEKLLALIRNGESKTLEFKETLSLDVAKQSKEKYIEISAMKTIAAFLNSEGGTLLIGVNDKGEISSLQAEIDKFHKGSTDKYLLHCKNLIKSYIGEGFYPEIDYQVLSTFDGLVLSISCKQSTTACFIGDDFFVRTNPATDKLVGQKMASYLSKRFSS